MKSSKIPFISKNQSDFQRRFFSEYVWYTLIAVFAVIFVIKGIFAEGINFVRNTVSASPEYQNGDELKLEGEILQGQSNGLIAFRDTNHEDWWIKSKDLDISKYKGKAVIEGNIETSAIDGNFIIEISKIYKIVDSTTAPKIITKYMEIENGLQIDLSNNTNYFVDLGTDGSILIKDIRTFRPSMRIIPFMCDWTVDNKNCGKLIREGDQQNKFDMFISSYSMKYYKINDTVRFVDNKEGKGYHLTATDDATMYQLSEYISLLNKERITTKIYDRLNTLCTNEEYTMGQGEGIEVKKTNNNWFAIVTGKSEKGDPIQCEIYLDDTSKQGINFELRNILPI